MSALSDLRLEWPKAEFDVDIERELVARAREQGLSLTGPGGLLKQLTKTVLENRPGLGAHRAPGP